MKDLDLSRSVFDLTEQYPELVDVMVDLGFTEIAKPAMRKSVGKLMTIPRGAVMKGISMTDVIVALTQAGFSPKGEPPAFVKKLLGEKGEKPEATEAPATDAVPATPNRTEQIKGYLRRLSDGEDLEAVRAEFAAEFSEVDASEIMSAEQELMREGTPLEEVQRLCDVHSALFHGTTCGESTGSALANAEEAVQRMLADRRAAEEARSLEPKSVPGHPLNTLTRENEALEALLAQAQAALTQTEDGEDAYPYLVRVRDVAIHYAKKGDLLYPPLKVRYNIDGPSQVMWTVDDEIRDELARLCRATELDHAWMMAAEKVLSRAEEMIYKEANILFPICAQNFSHEEWVGIYRDSKDYATCLGVEPAVWDEAERELAQAPDPSPHEGEVVMPGGHMTVPQLTAMLNTIPMEISFIDDQNINRYFNEGPKVFKRPMAAIDREVFSCHPPKIEPMVRAILQDFRDGVRDSVPVWMEKGGVPFLVTYMAVRDADGTYLGCAEFVQDMSAARDHFARG